MLVRGRGVVQVLRAADRGATGSAVCLLPLPIEHLSVEEVRSGGALGRGSGLSFGFVTVAS